MPGEVRVCAHTSVHLDRTLDKPNTSVPSTVMSQNLGNPPSQTSASQQNMIQMIQPAQATRLLEALKEELAQAKAAGADTARARQHYARAEQIKQVLVNYRQQQQQRAAASQLNSGSSSAPGAGTAPGGSASTNGASQMASNSGINTMNNLQGDMAAGQGSVGGNPAIATSLAANNNSSFANSNNGAANFPNSNNGSGNFPNGGNVAAAAGGPATLEPAQPVVSAGVTLDKYNQVRSRLQDLERRIRTLEATKRPDMKPEESTQIDNQLQELRLKYGQYSKFALYMRHQLGDQIRASLGPSTPSAAPSAVNNGTNSAGSMSTSANVATNVNSSVTPNVTNALLAATNANAQNSDNPSSGSGAIGESSTATSGAKSLALSANTPIVGGVNVSLVTKPSVPSMPILSTLNVKPHNPITLKPGQNSVRPTLTGGSTSGLGQVINSPAIMRMPTFDVASTGPIQDNSGRVLTKRKLTELVNTIGADEGDGKTTIDGDVEELLLDLADEFVSSVTTFACRLAKHRKTDSIDVRDVQLHLERNWNVRVPGYAMDEVRTMRKWQPSSLYNQKVSGVDIVKAVNGNIN